jgi:hypothetical protein
VPGKYSIRPAPGASGYSRCGGFKRSTQHLLIEIINELRGFESASQSTALAAKYIVALAAALSGDLQLSKSLLVELSGQISFANGRKTAKDKRCHFNMAQLASPALRFRARIRSHLTTHRGPGHSRVGILPGTPFCPPPLPQRRLSCWLRRSAFFAGVPSCDAHSFSVPS